MSIQVKVGDYDDLRGHVEYTIEVKDVNGEIWCFKRRYSALRFFHELLKKSEKRVPNFPPKKIFGNLNPDFLESRKKQIEQYFISLTKIPEIVHSAAFKDFIKPFDKAPVIKNKKAQKKIFTKEISDAIYDSASKIIEEAGREFVNLTPYNKLGEEEITKIKNDYALIVLNLKVNENLVMPKAIPENVAKLNKNIVASKIVAKWFSDLSRSLVVEKIECCEAVIRDY